MTFSISHPFTLYSNPHDSAIFPFTPSRQQLPQPKAPRSLITDSLNSASALPSYISVAAKCQFERFALRMLLYRDMLRRQSISYCTRRFKSAVCDTTAKQAGTCIGVLITMVDTESVVLICIDRCLGVNSLHSFRYRPSAPITISRFSPYFNLTDCWSEDVPQLAVMCEYSDMQLNIGHGFQTMHLHHPMPASTTDNFKAGMISFRYSRDNRLHPSHYPSVTYQQASMVLKLQYPSLFTCHAHWQSIYYLWSTDRFSIPS